MTAIHDYFETRTPEVITVVRKELTLEDLINGLEACGKD